MIIKCPISEHYPSAIILKCYYSIAECCHVASILERQGLLSGYYAVWSMLDFKTVDSPILECCRNVLLLEHRA